ncbi:MAG: RNA polymerase sigma factor [Acidimicrobiales bacterium]
MNIQDDALDLLSEAHESDHALVHASQGGDGGALDALLHRHYPRLFGLCRRMVGENDADDTTQNALIAIVRGLPGFDSRSTFVTWSYRVATNACLDEIRRRTKRPVLKLVDDDSYETIGSLRSESEIDRVADRIDLDAALATLAIEQRVAVILRDLCSLSYDEIAIVLDIAPGTVRSRIARGRGQLHNFIIGNSATVDQRPSSKP